MESHATPNLRRNALQSKASSPKSNEFQTQIWLQVLHKINMKVQISTSKMLRSLISVLLDQVKDILLDFFFNYSISYINLKFIRENFPNVS